MDFSKFNQQANVGTQAASYDQGLRTYMLSVYNYMAAALALTGVVAGVLWNMPGVLEQIAMNPILRWGIILGQLGMVIFFSVRIHAMSFTTAQAVFWVYSALTGVTFAFLLAVYTGESVMRAFLITAATFGAMSLYGYSTKRDLTGMGSFMIMGLFGIIIASIVNLFMQSGALQFAISVIGVLVFVGLTAYDTQKIRDMYLMGRGAGDQQTLGKMAISGALTLYLDFINLMIMLLRLIGDRR